METNSNENSGLVIVSEMYPENLLVLPVEGRPVFPRLSLPFSFSDERLQRHIELCIEKNKGYAAVSLIEEKDEENYLQSRLFRTGSLIRIQKIISRTEENISFFAQVLTRVHLEKQTASEEVQYWQVSFEYEEKKEITPELKAYSLAIINSVKELIKMNPIFQEQIRLTVTQVGIEKLGLLSDLISSFLTSDGRKLQKILETGDLYERSELLLVLLKEEIELNQIQKKIEKQIEEKLNRQQRDFLLREQLKAIKKELGLEKEDKDSEAEIIGKKIRKLVLTEEASRVINEELEKLKTLESSSSEYNVTKTYLNWLTDLPWGIFSEDNFDIQKAREILNEQHYGLADVKQRILEFISTIIKRGRVSGSIVCLVGPPGVGKTSIGKSIADALGRKFYRFSVGGMRDEAEIKGHRRTYIGAMPGKFIQSLKRTEVSNPVIMLDEIDKIGTSYQGDPAAALLEVLDPEQNHEFLDHYLDVRYDLSNILFVTTANQLDTIPGPLLDRMEIIKLSGYILEEKAEIAKRYLIPKQMKEHGIRDSELQISDSVLSVIADQYARESGVRSMENQIKKIMRKTALLQAEKNLETAEVTPENIQEFLGPPVFTSEELYEKEIPGVALGLAWTSLGGATLYIEAGAVSSTAGGMRQTGQLGNVMRESSEIAYSFVKALIQKENRENRFFDEHFIHLHVPAGATPKDGPSAGITLATALYSLARNIPVKKGLAMTGELTLTGKILPIGGVREKTIAARRVKVYELIFPKANRRDFEELPEYLKDGIKVHFADFFDEVLKIAFFL